MSEYLTMTDVAEILQIGKETARKLMHTMPHIVIGGKQHETIRVSRADFERELEQRKRYPTAERELEVKRQKARMNDLVARGLMNPDGSIARRKMA